MGCFWTGVRGVGYLIAAGVSFVSVLTSLALPARRMRELDLHDERVSGEDGDGGETCGDAGQGTEDEKARTSES